ncbi:TrbG/VirB9 family P-type conjugative transfer protein [Paraburkholderia strydomiana]|uniref:TrbG/VirB9 family P-type conjugative transfer protein n=1 Tax=Paraburkholderia strydomiana TaxID=1245417 RepID=UPI001BE85570|nr:TrbG/VirB9 family P-type conjugative transfer protein [Paraburkholderia strydomiana]
MILTSIELEPGEKLIANPATGDSIHWAVDDDKMNHVFIKPHKADIVNTLHLTANRREYDFTLIASPAGAFFYQTVRFRYPRAPMARSNARDENGGAGLGATGGERGGDSGPTSVAPDKLKWDYPVDGSKEFKPEVVSDDGYMIWMRMPAKAPTWPVAARPAPRLALYMRMRIRRLGANAPDVSGGTGEGIDHFPCAFPERHDGRDAPCATNLAKVEEPQPLWRPRAEGLYSARPN